MSNENSSPKHKLSLEESQWKPVAARVCQAMLNQQVLTWPEFSTLVKNIIFKICAFEHEIEEGHLFNPEFHEIHDDTTSKAIRRANNNFRPLNLKLQVDQEFWVEIPASEKEQNYVILRSTASSNLQNEACIKISEKQAFNLKPIKEGTSESKFLAIVVSGLVNSRLGALTDADLIDLKPDQVNFGGKYKIPAGFTKDKEYYLQEFINMGFLSRVEGNTGVAKYYTLSKRFRKENAKLIEALLHRDDEDSSVTDTVLAQICMCEVSDLPTLLQ